MASEAINSYGMTVGTATTTIVGMSADAQYVIIQNQEPSSDTLDYARDGHQYFVFQTFTISALGTVNFAVATGAGGLQVDYFETTSTVENVSTYLIEGATVVTTGAAIPAYNLNRNVSDTVSAVFKAATSVTGGTVVAQEFITADKKAAGGGKTSGQIYTLKPSNDYALRFVNEGNQETKIFYQLGFVEDFNGNNDVWLGGSVGSGLRLRGGQTVHLPMIQGQTLSAVASQNVQIAVLRQD